MSDQVCLLAGHNKRGADVLDFVTKLEPGHPVTLIRDARNQYDKNAVQVHTHKPDGDELMIGFIAKAHNSRIAAWMDKLGNGAFAAVFGFAGTGKSRVPAVKITFPDEESAS
jgi:hypothetical protein